MHTPHTPIWHHFSQTKELDQALASFVAEQLNQALCTHGRASLAVSGGRTPAGFLQALSREALEWSSIHIILCDERWVPNDHADSNTQLIQQHLLCGAAAAAQFYPLYNGAHTAEEGEADLNRQLAHFPWPLDVAVLGMGEDGHTASLFPLAPELNHAYQASTHCVAITPVTAPHTRISLTLHTLSQAQCLITHIVGASKQALLEKALSSTTEPALPIRRVLDTSQQAAHIFCATVI